MKLKKNLIFLLFLLIAFASHGQRSGRQDVKVGFDFARFSSLPANSNSFRLEYTKAFSEPFFLGFTANVSNFEFVPANIPVISDFLTASIDLNLYYAILRNERNQFRAGAALSARYFNDQFDLDNNPAFLASSMKVGPAIKVHYDVLLNDQWLFGVNGSAAFYGQENNVFLAGAHAGVKF